MDKPWRLSQIDGFLQKFFFNELPSTFRIDTHSTIISIFLKNRSTQDERVRQLINKVNRQFLLNETVQRIIVRSERYRSLIDQLLEDEKCLTVEKLANNQPETKNMKLPGFHISILSSSFRYFTGKQQEYLTKIILHDFLQVNQFL